MRKNVIPVALFFSLVLTASQSAAEVRYSITDLGTATTPLAINNNGQIVGSAAMADGNSQAFVYQNGALTTLGTFGGTASVAAGINNSGSITGTFTTISGNTHGFLYKNGFNDLFSAAGLIEAKSVNDKGVVLGLINSPYDSSTDRQTVLYDNGLITNISLEKVPWDSQPIAINNSGQAVYFQWVCSDCDLSFLYSIEGTTTYNWFEAADLNDLGDLVGHTHPNVNNWGDQGVWYHDGEKTLITGLPEKANYPSAINNKRQIVGKVKTDGGTYTPFIYSNFALTELSTLIPPDSGWVLAEATDINDNGEIVGYGKFQENWHGYLLQPWQKVELQILSKVDTRRLDSNRLFQGAILGSADFDASTVNPQTIKLAGALNIVGRKNDLKDVNQDGLIDLVFRVPVKDMSIYPNGGSSPLVLEAQTYDGQRVGGEASLVNR